MDLPEIMDHTEKQPLDVDLDLPSKRKPIQPQGACDIPKHRLYNAHPSTIKKPSLYRIDLFDHLVGKGLSALFRLAVKEGDLSRTGVRIP